MTQKSETVQRALHAAETVYNALQRVAKPGATERDLEAAVRAAAGGHEVQFDLLTGPRTAEIEGGATERVLAAGDPLLLDLCLKQDDCWCDVCRTYFLVHPAAEAAQAYETVLACVRHIAGLLCPGEEAASLYRAAEAFFRNNGLQGKLRHHTGHGIGHTPFEAPVEVADSQDVLHEGDIVTVEIGAYYDGSFGIRLEDDYLITAQGAAPLWEYPMSLQSAVI